MSKARTKKENAYRLFMDMTDLFQCPICAGVLYTVEPAGLCCPANHHFDLAKNGYVNLLIGQQRTQYGKDLFQARRAVFDAGVYDPLITKIHSMLQELTLNQPVIVDAGCGEGSFLTRLGKEHAEGFFVGIDISRDGIYMAASQPDSILWCVADLAKLPLRTASVDVLLNILSPANYGEFRRVLRPEGFVFKVLPGKYYLQEIRDRLNDTEEYSNKEVLAKMEQNLNLQQRVLVQYQVPVTAELWSAVVEMTPLTQHRKVQGTIPRSLTIDLEIIQGSMVNGKI